MKPIAFLFLLLCSIPLSAQDGQTAATAVSDGQVSNASGKQLAWDNEKKSWVELEQFWLNYAQRNGGLTWGRGTNYPPYDQVSEFDTFMVEIQTGPCLMEFFHQRWRRANDVRRWDDAFNQYAGCPNVFD